MDISDLEPEPSPNKVCNLKSSVVIAVSVSQLRSQALMTILKAGHSLDHSKWEENFVLAVHDDRVMFGMHPLK